MVATILSLIALCCSLSWLTRLRTKSAVSGWEMVAESKRQIEVEIAGAVISPGKYQFSPGITLKEVLGVVGLSKQADRKKINFKKIIYIPERIEIPEKQKKVGRKQLPPVSLFSWEKSTGKQNLIV